MSKHKEKYDLWDAFLAEWPIERLHTMTLEEYAGPGEDSFLNWVEIRVDKLGKLHDQFIKWCICRKDMDKRSSEWGLLREDEQYMWYAALGQTAQDAFVTVRSMIHQMALDASNGNFEALDSVQIIHTGAKLRLLFLYQDRLGGKIPAIFSVRYLVGKYGEMPGRSVDEKSFSDYRKALCVFEDLICSSIFDARTMLDAVCCELTGGEAKMSRIVNSPLNLLLHGPPGTGKTYELRRMMRESFGDAPDSSCFVTFHPSMTYEDFIEGFRPEILNGAMSYTLKPGLFKEACEAAVLQTGFEEGLAAFCALSAEERKKRLEGAPPVTVCIDEINRGNIARIFGELITLIEPDKRLGAEHELIVTLPGSRELFGVPSNLYIIGTMNTADRSVVALDVALRRRFAFQSFPPDPSTLAGAEVEGVELDKLLEAINARLRVLRDDDHLIGHAFLLRVEDLEGLRRVFKTSIVPLLVEYFYEDLGRVGLVLGGRFVRREAQAVRFARFAHDQAEELAERAVWSLVDVDTLGAEDFRSIYA